MASKFNKGDSVFFLMQDGKSVLDSQLKPRMYKSIEACNGRYPAWRDGEAEIVEYVSVVRCKDCWRYGKLQMCPFAYKTKPSDFCFLGENVKNATG